MSIPRKDSALVDWSTNADARLNADAAAYGTTEAVASAYRVVHNAFVAAYNNLVAARAAGIRSEALTSLMAKGKAELLDFARPLYATIKVNAAVSDAAKIELGVKLPVARRTPQPVPDFAPGLTVVSVDGRRVTIRLSDPANPTHRRMPAGTDGAILMSHVGGTPPSDSGAFKYECSTSRTTAVILFPESVVPGTKVYITAAFFNGRKQNGPACAAVGTTINYGGSMPMAA